MDERVPEDKPHAALPHRQLPAATRTAGGAPSLGSTTGGTPEFLGHRPLPSGKGLSGVKESGGHVKSSPNE